KGGKEIKMIQTGGIAGTFIKPDKLDVQLDYDSITRDGVALGSGVILVADETNCPVDIALSVMKFFEHESCGKCTPCREGTRMAVQILERIRNGIGEREDLRILRDIALTAGEASFCGLGQSIPNPLLTLMDLFEDEFMEHIVDKKCRSNVCKFEKLKKPKRIRVKMR
ncbi:MAG: NADP oxidoreductase, partial [Thermotoga sp.]